MSRLLVGDDVVDLSRERTRGKAADRRFLERILTPGEIRIVREAREPDLELWTLWACKEAGFKIHSKAQGEPPTFVHTAYRVEPSLPRAPQERRPTGGEEPSGTARQVIRARVRWPGGAAIVAVRRSRRLVHAVGRQWQGPDRMEWDAEAPPLSLPTTHRMEWGLGRLDAVDALWAGPLPGLMERFTPAEADAIHSRASAAARLAARRMLAELLAVDEGRLEIVCAPGPSGRRPPTVRLDGEACDADVSFTHDGRWLAWTASAPRSSRRVLKK